jgi:hypothetical protein
MTAFANTLLENNYYSAEKIYYSMESTLRDKYITEDNANWKKRLTLVKKWLYDTNRDTLREIYCKQFIDKWAQRAGQIQREDSGFIYSQTDPSAYAKNVIAELENLKIPYATAKAKQLRKTFRIT